MGKFIIFGTGVVCRAFMRSYSIDADTVTAFLESEKSRDFYCGADTG